MVGGVARAKMHALYQHGGNGGYMDDSAIRMNGTAPVAVAGKGHKMMAIFTTTINATGLERLNPGELV